MGSYGSGKSSRRTPKTDTDGLLFLDIRYLATHGYLDPGCRSLGWSRGDRPSGTIVVCVDPEHPDALVLAYRTRRPGEAWEDVREVVRIERTGCHYGGTRPWLRCPRCLSRRAVLFSVGGRFRCRACHDLAYTSTRESEGDRMMRRAAVIRKRLGAPSSGDRWGHVPKPKGMRWATYDRLAAELHECRVGALADLSARTDKLFASLDRKHGKRG